MTWNEPGNRIPSDCGSDGPDRPWRTNDSRDVRICRHVTRRNVQERLPHLDLKGRTDQEQRHCPVSIAALRKGRCNHRGENCMILLVRRLRPPRPQICHRRARTGFSRKPDAANAPCRAHDERRSEGTAEPAPANLQPLSTPCVVAGTHRLPSHEQIVKPSRPRQADFVRSFKRRVPTGQKRLRVIKPQPLLVPLG